MLTAKLSVTLALVCVSVRVITGCEPKLMVVGKTVACGIGLVPVPFGVTTMALPLVGVTVTVAVREPVELAPGAKVTVILQVLRAFSVVPLDPPQLSDSESR